MNDSIFILGAGGFIGRRLAETLAKSGTSVVAATRRPTVFSDPLITNVFASFDAADQFAATLAGCRAIVHAASASTPGSSAAQPQLDGNLRSTLAMIEALQDTQDIPLLYLSSGGTLYGDRHGTAREDDPLRPRSYHGAGKAAAEHFIQAWAAQYGGTATILRPSNVYGPGQSPKPGFGIVSTAFDCAVHGTPITVWGDGGAVRDYLYVDDLVRLCHAVLDHETAPGTHVFNASAGQGITLNLLLDAIDAVTGTPLARDYQPPRQVDVHAIVPDNAAARRVFEWQPATTLESGLRTTWHWFNTQP